MFISAPVPLQHDGITHLRATPSSAGARTAWGQAVTPPIFGAAMRALGILGLALWLGHAAQAQTILGSTGAYAVMAGSTVTINGSTLTGNLGAANIAGSGYTTLTGSQVIPIVAQNVTDLTRAYSGLANMTPTANLSGQNLGGMTLSPGIYRFDTTATLTGTLTLNALNQSNAVWVFQIGSTFDTTASNATVTFTNVAANSIANNGLFWQVGTAATIGAGSTLEGNFLGSSSSTFSFGSGATLNHGRVLTGATGTIGLATNTINFIAADSGYSGGLAFVGTSNVITAVPEPATYAFFAGAIALATVVIRRRSPRAAAQA